MSAHRVIVVSQCPKGHFIEGMGKAGQVFYPGMAVSIEAAAGLDSDGRPQYELWNAAADGDRAEAVIVRENDLFGGTVDDAYPDSPRLFLYVPGKGDEVQVLFKNVGTGTGAGQEDVALNDKMIVDDTTGKFIVTTGSPEEEIAQSLEILTNVEEDTLLLVRWR